MDPSVFLLLALLPLVSGGFNGRGNNPPYTAVPHSAIGEEETSIYLAHNTITNISDYEFAKYVNLTVLTLRSNPIQTIPDKAFANTKIRDLDLSSTKITNFPNLTVIAQEHPTSCTFK